MISTKHMAVVAAGLAAFCLVGTESAHPAPNPTAKVVRKSFVGVGDRTLSVNCPRRWHATGGGFTKTSDLRIVKGSWPRVARNGVPIGWQVRFVAGPGGGSVYAVCAR